MKKIITIIITIVMTVMLFINRIVVTTAVLKVEFPDFSYEKHSSVENKAIQVYYNHGKRYTGKVIFSHGSYKEEGEYRNGIREGIWITKVKRKRWLSFFSEGTSYIETIYKNGIENGVYKSYYRESFESMKLLVEEGNYIEGRREGLWKLYHKGKLMREYNYKNDKLDGPQRNYDEKGKLISTDFYENGKLIK
ncbi:MAG: toxin-antitoxin system YwqK family antitoxin [Fusobacteriaceae bacterium]